MHPALHQLLSQILRAIGIWVDELQVNQLLDAPFFRLMAEECTDIATGKDIWSSSTTEEERTKCYLRPLLL